MVLEEKKAGGEGGIRTPEGLSPLPAFEAGAFNRSATSPGLIPLETDSLYQIAPRTARLQVQQKTRRPLSQFPFRNPIRSARSFRVMVLSISCGMSERLVDRIEEISERRTVCSSPPA